MKKQALKKEFWIILLSVLILGLLLGLFVNSGTWWRGWLAYSVLLAIAAATIYGVWRAVRADPQVTTAALVAFFLRLGVGVALLVLLPLVGYKNNPEHVAGYVYTDAYIRDNQAWDLATSGKPILSAFSGQYSGDQYGGMLALSASLYRLISLDAHRPLLIIIFGAAVSAWGVLFLWKATRSWFDHKTALLAAWLFALYPESVLLGSSQMREAIVMPAITIGFYGISEVVAKRKTGWLWLILTALILFPIQPLVGVIALFTLAGVWLLDPSARQSLKSRQTLVIIFIIFAVLVVAVLLASSILANLPSVQGSGPLGVFLTWFQNNFAFQSYLTEQSSGMFQNLVDSLGEQWRWLIVLVYGTAQPVLPAVVGDPDAAWIMRIIGFLRAAGWYALALFLVYGTLGAFRHRIEPRRLQLIWLSLITWAWVMISALNAGADQWDNPRYRAILLIWQVILAAWAWSWARSHQDAWLWRWLAVEVVFVGLFTEWYLGRYYPGFIHLDIKIMTLVTLVICAAILLGGVIWDRTRKKKLSSPDSSL